SQGLRGRRPPVRLRRAGTYVAGRPVREWDGAGRYREQSWEWEQAGSSRGARCRQRGTCVVGHADFGIAEIAPRVGAPEIAGRPGAGTGVSVADGQPTAACATSAYGAWALPQLQ